LGRAVRYECDFLIHSNDGEIAVTGARAFNACKALGAKNCNSPSSSGPRDGAARARFGRLAKGKAGVMFEAPFHFLGRARGFTQAALGHTE
jgi:hypothetical protein